MNNIETSKYLKANPRTVGDIVIRPRETRTKREILEEPAMIARLEKSRLEKKKPTVLPTELPIDLTEGRKRKVEEIKKRDEELALESDEFFEILTKKQKIAPDVTVDKEPTFFRLVKRVERLENILEAMHTALVSTLPPRNIFKK